MAKNKPARGKARRVNIYIPADLSDKLLEFEDINISRTCRVALEIAVRAAMTGEQTLAGRMYEAEEEVKTLRTALKRVANFAARQVDMDVVVKPKEEPAQEAVVDKANDTGSSSQPGSRIESASRESNA